MFLPYTGDDLMGLTVTKNHEIYIWARKDCKVLFSATRHGNALSCHFASDKRGLRYLKQAIKEFMSFICAKYKWCEYIIAVVTRPSVERLVKKLGFEKLVGPTNNGTIYGRKAWAA